MCLIKKILQKNILIRYDEDGAIPYYRSSDFPGLNVEEKTFTNSKGVEIHYFFYNYDNYKKDKIILVCHGLGPGHSAYLAEIEVLCKAGYRVLTLDYTGCGFSKGERMDSINAPTRDTMELLDLLKLQEEIVVYGHSLGGYTAINILNMRSDITKGVIISGFLTVKKEMTALTKNKIVGSLVSSFERRQDKLYGRLDNVSYLKKTTDKILFMQSKEDAMVSFDVALGEVLTYNNPNIECVVMEGKKHNPTYSYDAINYMNEVFYEYNNLIKDGTLDTLEKKKEYMSDKSIYKMTEPDMEVFNKIISFIG
ncbi:MAG: alpha/beta fold hydrolase [Bacilli bacterium]|nr:alpha/beta fold hydrolase [Bacilli bacterium]